MFLRAVLKHRYFDILMASWMQSYSNKRYKSKNFLKFRFQRSDGFYEADINGQRGLVPATFLKSCKRKSTKVRFYFMIYDVMVRIVYVVGYGRWHTPEYESHLSSRSM